MPFLRRMEASTAHLENLKLDICSVSDVHSITAHGKKCFTKHEYYQNLTKGA
jgi:hypothetical protein